MQLRELCSCASCAVARAVQLCELCICASCAFARAEQFCIRCKWDVTLRVESKSSELQWSILDKTEADTSVAVTVLVSNLQ